MLGAAENEKAPAKRELHCRCQPKTINILYIIAVKNAS